MDLAVCDPTVFDLVLGYRTENQKFDLQDLLGECAAADKSLTAVEAFHNAVDAVHPVEAVFCVWPERWMLDGAVVGAEL